MIKEYAKTFNVKVYGIQELALMYFPMVSPQSAARHLRRWIGMKNIAERLSESGYTGSQRVLTPKQVAIIVEHLGEP